MDGCIVGTGGYLITSVSASNVAKSMEAAIILQQAMGAPHNQVRFGRLATMLGVSRPMIDLCNPPWYSAQIERVFTFNFTRHPEAKVNRGILKLVERKHDDQHGFRLTYEAPVDERSVEEVTAAWWAKEQERIASLKPPKRRRAPIKA